MNEPMKQVHRRTALILAALGVTSLVLLGGAATQAAEDACPTMGVKDLTGAGSTFDFPLFSKMFDAYNKLCGVKVNYQSIGSGGGIRQLQQMTVDFGASDGVMTEQQRRRRRVVRFSRSSSRRRRGHGLQFARHRSGAIKLTPDILADIYLKKIKKWNDQRIAALNPASSFRISISPSCIAPMGRERPSSLRTISPKYPKSGTIRSDTATSVNWPGDIGGAGNEGVANQVKQIPGAIGYVELAYANRTRCRGRACGTRLASILNPRLKPLLLPRIYQPA